MTSILRIVGPDSIYNNTIIYYVSTREDKPGERHIYSVEVPGRKMSLGQFDSHFKTSNLLYKTKTTDMCYTCDQIELNQCLYNSVSLSTKASYFVHQCLGPELPYSTLRRISNLTDIRPWLNNNALKATLENKLLPTVRNELIPASNYCKYQNYCVVIEFFFYILTKQ